MRRYILQRLFAAIPVILLVGIIVFSLLHIAPGDPAAILAGDDPNLMTAENIQQIRESMGLDRPFLVQFGDWVWGLLQGDLGTSYFSQRSVASLMAPRLQPTLSLAVMALLISLALGAPLGMLAAWKAHTLVDRAVMIFAVMGFSVPVFWFGFILIWTFAVRFPLFPALGYTPISEGLFSFLRSLFLPAIGIAVAQMALIARMTRSTMLEVLSEDYIRTARAKGLGERMVLTRHAFKAASIPIITIIGIVFAGLVGGLVVVEVVFSVPGMGRLVIDSIVRRDFPVIQGTLMVVAVVYVFINLAVDIIYAYVDPRITY